MKKKYETQRTALDINNMHLITSKYDYCLVVKIVSLHVTLNVDIF